MHSSSPQTIKKQNRVGMHRPAQGRHRPAQRRHRPSSSQFNNARPREHSASQIPRHSGQREGVRRCGPLMPCRLPPTLVTNDVGRPYVSMLTAAILDAWRGCEIISPSRVQTTARRRHHTTEAAMSRPPRLPPPVPVWLPLHFVPCNSPVY